VPVLECAPLVFRPGHCPRSSQGPAGGGAPAARGPSGPMRRTTPCLVRRRVAPAAGGAENPELPADVGLARTVLHRVARDVQTITAAHNALLTNMRGALAGDLTALRPATTGQRLIDVGSLRSGTKLSPMFRCSRTAKKATVTLQERAVASSDLRAQASSAPALCGAERAHIDEPLTGRGGPKRGQIPRQGTSHVGEEGVVRRVIVWTSRATRCKTVRARPTSAGNSGFSGATGCRRDAPSNKAWSCPAHWSRRSPSGRRSSAAGPCR